MQESSTVSVGSFTEQDKQQRCELVSGSVDATLQELVNLSKNVKRKIKRKIKMLILTGCRERAFLLCSMMCKEAKTSPIMCHASVGSLKFERDLKALHNGVDVLIVTPGRLSRLFSGNENCFDSIQTVVLDQCELLCSRAMIKSTKESLSLFSINGFSAYTSPDSRVAKNCCSKESIYDFFSSNQITVISERTLQPSPTLPLPHLPHPCTTTFSILPDADALAVINRSPHIIHNIFTSLSSGVSFIAVTTSSEYKLNLLLSLLLDKKPTKVHILCASEMNTHKDVKSRFSFINETYQRNNNETVKVPIVLLVHDCWLPYFDHCSLFDKIINMDLPLSEAIFIDRMMLLDGNNGHSTNSHYFVSSIQISVLELLHSTYGYEMEEMIIDDDLVTERKIIERYQKKDKEGLEVEMEESVELEGLTEVEEHQLFYVNEKAEMVVCDEIERETVQLDDVDLSGLEEEEEEEEEEVRGEKEGEEMINEEEKGVKSEEWNVMKSVFNPFVNPMQCGYNLTSSCNIFYFVVCYERQNVIC